MSSTRRLLFRQRRDFSVAVPASWNEVIVALHVVSGTPLSPRSIPPLTLLFTVYLVESVPE